MSEELTDAEIQQREADADWYEYEQAKRDEIETDLRMSGDWQRIVDEPEGIE